METPLSLSPAEAAVPGLPGPVTSATPVTTPAPAAVTSSAAADAATNTALPGLSPGHQSSEFYLALAIVTGIFAALWNGKLDPTLASALLGLIVSGYPSLRTWLKSRHVDAVAAVLAAARGGNEGVALTTLAGAVEAPDLPSASTAPQASLPASNLNS